MKTNEEMLYVLEQYRWFVRSGIAAVGATQETHSQMIGILALLEWWAEVDSPENPIDVSLSLIQEIRKVCQKNLGEILQGMNQYDEETFLKHFKP